MSGITTATALSCLLYQPPAQHPGTPHWTPPRAVDASPPWDTVTTINNAHRWSPAQADPASPAAQAASGSPAGAGIRDASRPDLASLALATLHYAGTFEELLQFIGHPARAGQPTSGVHALPEAWRQRAIDQLCAVMRDPRRGVSIREAGSAVTPDDAAHQLRAFLGTAARAGIAASGLHRLPHQHIGTVLEAACHFPLTMAAAYHYTNACTLAESTRMISALCSVVAHSIRSLPQASRTPMLDDILLLADDGTGTFTLDNGVLTGYYVQRLAMLRGQAEGGAPTPPGVASPAPSPMTLQQLLACPDGGRDTIADAVMLTLGQDATYQSSLAPETARGTPARIRERRTGIQERSAPQSPAGPWC